MIWRIRQRRIFDSLRREGIKIRHGSVSMIFFPLKTQYPQVAYALTRRFGNSVVRSRGRRRLSEAFKKAYYTNTSIRPEGAFLISASPRVNDLPFTELVEQINVCLDKLVERNL